MGSLRLLGRGQGRRQRSRVYRSGYGGCIVAVLTVISRARRVAAMRRRL